MVTVVVTGLVAVDFAMLECSCTLGVVVEGPGTSLLLYKSAGTELCRVL